jgi:predicted lipase
MINSRLLHSGAARFEKKKFDLNKVMAGLKADVDIRLTDWPQGGKVHRGFKEALEEVWFDLFSYIRKLDSSGCKIWMTEHSLGAALATLCVGRYGNVQGVYTFGSPRVGNDVFMEKFDVNAYRIVNNDDIVAWGPPSGFYVHVGKLKFIDSGGIIWDHMIEKERPVNIPRDETYGRTGKHKTANAKFFCGICSGSIYGSCTAAICRLPLE